MSNEQEKIRLAQLLKAAMDELDNPTNIEKTKFLAVSAYRQYLAYLNAGFNMDQALKLVIAKL